MVHINYMLSSMSTFQYTLTFKLTIIVTWTPYYGKIYHLTKKRSRIDGNLLEHSLGCIHLKLPGVLSYRRDLLQTPSREENRKLGLDIFRKHLDSIY